MVGKGKTRESVRIKALLFSLCGTFQSILESSYPQRLHREEAVPVVLPGSPPPPVWESPRVLVVLLHLSVLFEFWLHLTLCRHGHVASASIGPGESGR